MAEHQRFHLHDLADLRAVLQRLGLELPLSEDFSVLGRPVAIGRHTAPNRFAVQPMEGFDADDNGAPGDLSLRRYTRYAAGGSGLIWFEATAVLREARSNPHQLWLHQGNVGAFRHLVDATRRAARDRLGREPVLVLQLTHSGRYSKPDGLPKPIIAHRSAVLDPLHKLAPDYPLVSDNYLDHLQSVYVQAAQLAAEAGFDGIDLKACHRYLISELLASFTRDGKYGGSFENRTRLLLETLARIRREAPGVFITTRLNVYDAIPHPYGFGVSQADFRQPDLAEPLRLVGELAALGVPLLNVSIGNPYYNPHYGRPYDFPVHGIAPPAEHPLEGVVRFVNITRRIQAAFPDLPVVGGGYSWLRHLLPYVAAGVVDSGGATLIGQGRGAFAYPDSVQDILTVGAMDPARCCMTCSACSEIMRDGNMTGCVVRDGELYGEQYRLGRRLWADRLREEAGRCRECEQPTCVQGCPAQVDIPAFVRAYAEGDIPQAYAVLRARNVLPEMCAYICPADQQCQGGCVERIFSQDPLPIADIQLIVTRSARRQGITGLKVPAQSTGRTVAVVGGGPAGLACAIKLLEKGHHVALFEKSARLGGTPDGLIPPRRFTNAAAEIDAILAPAREAGRITVYFDHALGRNVDLDTLRQQFDAVFLALGLPRSNSLGAADGVVDALVFLQQVKSGVRPRVPARVAVLGAGNTALDAALTARDLGATDVFVVYRRSFAEMPAWPKERDEFLAKGGHLLILTQPVRYQTDARGQLTGVVIARTELGEPDESGRRRPIIVPNSESVLTVDLAIEALGQSLPDELRQALPGLSFTPGGLVQVFPGSAFTGVEMVFAAGDLVNGGTTAVQGITEGMRAAEEIDRNLAVGVES